MDTHVAKDIISVIRTEKQKRSDRLTDADQNFAYDHWAFTDIPFINELCLMLLVAIRHEVERQLVSLAARLTGDGKDIDRKQYQEKLKSERDLLRKGGGWNKLSGKLKLASCAEWKSMETLRLLANCYKHSPSQEPTEELLKYLALDLTVKYQPLPDSNCFREGLAASVKLPKDADYCEIAENLLSRAERFLSDVQKQPMVSRVRRGPVSMKPSDHAC